MSEGDGSAKTFLSKNGVTLIMNLITIIVMAVTFGVTWANLQNAVSNNALSITQYKADMDAALLDVRAEIKSLTTQGGLNAVQFAEIQKDLTQIRIELAAQMTVVLDIRDKIYRE